MIGDRGVASDSLPSGASARAPFPIPAPAPTAAFPKPNGLATRIGIMLIPGVRGMPSMIDDTRVWRGVGCGGYCQINGGVVSGS